MKRVLIVGGVIVSVFSCAAHANYGYFDCSRRNNVTDSFPTTGYLLSYGLDGDGGWYDINGEHFNFTEEQANNPKAEIKGDKGDIIYGQGWDSHLLSFALLGVGGDRTIYACASMTVNKKELKQAISDMTYPGEDS